MCSQSNLLRPVAEITIQELDRMYMYTKRIKSSETYFIFIIFRLYHFSLNIMSSVGRMMFEGHRANFPWKVRSMCESFTM